MTVYVPSPVNRLLYLSNLELLGAPLQIFPNIKEFPNDGEGHSAILQAKDLAIELSVGSQIYDMNGKEMEDGLVYGPKSSEQTFPITFVLGNQC